MHSFTNMINILLSMIYMPVDHNALDYAGVQVKNTLVGKEE